VIDSEKVEFSLEKFKEIAALVGEHETKEQIIAREAIVVLEEPHEKPPHFHALVAKAAYSMYQVFTGRPWFNSVEIEIKGEALPVIILKVNRRCLESDAVGRQWAGFPVRVEVV
jgi:hypothetical protein